MQSFIVALILVACVAYTVRRLWKRFHTPPHGDLRCEGCPLAETCKHHTDHGQYGEDCPRGTACDCCH